MATARSTDKKQLEAVRNVARRLKKEYRDYAHGNRSNPLDELIFILLSVRTQEIVHLRVFRELKRTFPTFWSLHSATERQIAKVLRPSGLPAQRANLIKKVLRASVKEFGRPTLAPLSRMSDADAESFLLSLPGVGLKVARCVMMYSLDRSVFPVDSNCLRVIVRLGWVDAPKSLGECSDHLMDEIQAIVPPKNRYSLHVNLVSHGRRACRSVSPQCGECCIRSECHWAEQHLAD